MRRPAWPAVNPSFKTSVDAFRRPLTDEEQARFSSFFSDRLESGSYKDAIQVTAQAFDVTAVSVSDRGEKRQHQVRQPIVVFSDEQRTGCDSRQDADKGV